MKSPISFIYLFYFEMASLCSSDWLGTQCVDQTVLAVMELCLPPPLKCWYLRQASYYVAQAILFLQPLKCWDYRLAGHLWCSVGTKEPNFKCLV